MSAQDRTQIYQQIIAKCWSDEEFKASLIADPRGILALEGFIVPAGKTIKIVECLEDEIVFQILCNNRELAPDELDRVGGGIAWNSLNQINHFSGRVA